MTEGVRFPTFAFITGGAGQADDAQLSAAHVGAVPDCQLAQSRHWISHPDEAGCVGQVRIGIHYRPGRPLLKRREGIVVAVEVLSAQGKKHLARLDGAAVCRNAIIAAAVFFIKCVHLLQCYLVPVLPKPPSPLSDEESSPTSSH